MRHYFFKLKETSTLKNSFNFNRNCAKIQKEVRIMNEIIKIFRDEFPYIDRQESTIMGILKNPNNHFIEKRDAKNNLIAISVINNNTIIFFCVVNSQRNKGIGSALLKESEDYIKNNGFDSVVIGAGFSYIMPGVPTSKKYYDAVNEHLVKQVNENASNFFENRGYYHSWDCNCFDMKMDLKNFNKLTYAIGDKINNVKYRWATKAEIQEIMDCADDACQYQETKFSKYYKNEKMYHDANNERVLVAEKNGRIIGCIIVSAEVEAKQLGNVGCTCVRFAETHQGIGSNMVILGTRYLYDIGLKKASLGYTYSGLDKMYGNAGYEISCYYMMAKKDLNK